MGIKETLTGAKYTILKPKSAYVMNVQMLLNEPKGVLNTSRFILFVGLLSYGYSLYLGSFVLNVLGVMVMFGSLTVYFVWKEMSDKHSETYELLRGKCEDAIKEDFRVKKK